RLRAASRLGHRTIAQVPNDLEYARMFGISPATAREFGACAARAMGSSSAAVAVVYFVVLVGVLIFVHELGHFVWAKIFGVKVLMFSIGFGPKIVRIRGRETEYCIGLFPLCGFVKMLEENRQEPVWPEDKHRTFDSQPLYKRAI